MMKDESCSLQKGNKGGKVLPALCDLFGTLILIIAIASCLPMVVPRVLGYEVYNVVSGSMEPEISVGSVLYVKKVAPEEIAEGEIIAFESGNSVITHRVVENLWVEGKFRTKGDANAEEDMNTVDYRAVIGRVIWHFPIFGAIMEIYTSTIGKIYVILFAACGALLKILAGNLRERREIQA